MDISDFYATFFEEADELLADMERQLLDLDIETPDPEQLNAIFRAAHSIKGGAGTFGFDVLQHTTHLLENLLDHARHETLTLDQEIIDLFLFAKDGLQNQLSAYRSGAEPDAEEYATICQRLERLASQEVGQPVKKTQAAPAVAIPGQLSSSDIDGNTPRVEGDLQLLFSGIDEKNRGLLLEELAHLGEVKSTQGDEHCFEVRLATEVTAEDIETVMCFIIEPDQLRINKAAPEETDEEAPVEKTLVEKAPIEKKTVDKASKSPGTVSRQSKPKAAVESSIRVSVEKVDQIINLVGELIITQSMLDETVSRLQTSGNAALVNGMSLLQRNARDLQEAVMSIRMVPMDYVFSRFPRLVHDLAKQLGKEVELITDGEATELDKSLTERIIDPLTHLIRNSLDHGIETPEKREASGKPRTGRLTLSAQHQGGQILIEIVDDGAGMDREILLAKARENGLAMNGNISDDMSDEDVWQLIFAPGFSTSKTVSDVSGRGVGMDVVKRNIQSLGGHVEIFSRPGEGTTTRIVLPLTLAILDGMSVKVGNEIFVLPLSAVIESLQPTPSMLHVMNGRDLLLKVRDDYLPVVALNQLLDIDDACQEPTQGILVIVRGKGRRYALLVDRLVGQQQVVVKNLETNYRKVPGISAATILGDGSVSLILDIAGLHHLSCNQKERFEELQSS
ncbi:chemotaxis protein CheA [Pistricoccus aurantiacus]|uniref:Chemotaxis protein CheA n=1 Tax=Pistricoccus aurantiacus TaxID=1883414 RepID=A0A5B8SVU0_9GAMM|nr:chemotaxis protein CheA [Pistricoccus aurantiacus]QEA40264.1 chemotaxis protein CheA [Pistricoccus aurantiacus]